VWLESIIAQREPFRASETFCYRQELLFGGGNLFPPLGRGHCAMEKAFPKTVRLTHVNSKQSHAFRLSRKTQEMDSEKAILTLGCFIFEIVPLYFTEKLDKYL
jgi:hypothetical protein